MTSDGSRDVVVEMRRGGAETRQDAHWEDCMPSPSTANLILQPISLCLSVWSVDPANWSVAGQRDQVDNTIISHWSARRLTTYRIAAIRSTCFASSLITNGAFDRRRPPLTTQSSCRRRVMSLTIIHHVARCRDRRCALCTTTTTTTMKSVLHHVDGLTFSSQSWTLCCTTPGVARLSSDSLSNLIVYYVLTELQWTDIEQLLRNRQSLWTYFMIRPNHGACVIYHDATKVITQPSNLKRETLWTFVEPLWRHFVVYRHIDVNQVLAERCRTYI